MYARRTAAEVDAIVCSLFLTVLPDCGPCLENALKWLRPGGRLVILDSIPQPDRPLARLVIRAKAPLVGAHPSALPLEFARARLEGGAATPAHYTATPAVGHDNVERVESPYVKD